MKQSAKQKVKREFSAGGVVYKKEGSLVKWLVCKHSGYHKWVFPKGIVKKSETSVKTAIREVQEETGVEARIIEKVPESEEYIYQRDGAKIFKRVIYFLMEYTAGDIKDHDEEMEAVRWLPYQRAQKILAFAGAKKLLQKSREILKEKRIRPNLL